MMCDRKRFFAIKTLWVLANLAGTIILTVQLAHVLEGYIRPTVTRTWEEEILLKDIEFPLVVKVCVVPGFNQTAIHEVGYADAWNYFRGQSRFNNSFIGWAGHTEESGTYGTVEQVLAKIGDYKIENILDGVDVATKDGEGVNISLTHLNASRVNYPNNCHNLYLSQIPELKGKNIQRLFFNIGNLGNHSITVHFNGDTLDTRRNIMENSFQSFGDPIHLSEEDVSKVYMVDITQRIFVEEDPTNTCRVYPNQEYQSYQDCDDQFMKKLLPGLTPIWL